MKSDLKKIFKEKFEQFPKSSVSTSKVKNTLKKLGNIKVNYSEEMKNGQSKILKKNLTLNIKEYAFFCNKFYGENDKDFFCQVVPKLDVEQDLSLIVFVQMFGKKNQKLLRFVQKDLMESLKALLACGLALNRKEIGKVLMTCLLHLQRSLRDRFFLEAYNTGFSVFLALLHKKKVSSTNFP